MTYTKETGKMWQNENGKTSHMKVLMVHDDDDCGKNDSPPQRKFPNLGKDQ